MQRKLIRTAGPHLRERRKQNRADSYGNPRQEAINDNRNYFDRIKRQKRQTWWDLPFEEEQQTRL